MKYDGQLMEASLRDQLRFNPVSEIVDRFPSARLREPTRILTKRQPRNRWHQERAETHIQTGKPANPIVTIPPTMKAAAIDSFGPPSVLKIHTLPVPIPGPQEVLIAL